MTVRRLASRPAQKAHGGACMRNTKAAATAALLATILSALSAAALAQYRWTDPDGHVTYGDSPPSDAKNLQKLGVGAIDDPDPLRDAPYELRRAAANFPVVLYMADGCAPCQVARASLQSRGIPFSERAVTNPADLQELQRRGFGPTFPILT